MKHLKLALLALTTACILSGLVSSAAMAVSCNRAVEPNTGNRNNAICETIEANGPFIRITSLESRETGGVWCAKVAEPGVGKWNEAVCGVAGGTKNFVRVFAGPFWNVNGTRFESGTKQIKLQLKGSAVLKSSVGLEIECKNSISEGSTIEGNGLNQGQGKGRVTYSSCKVLAPAAKEGKECKVKEPITTNPLKSYLANSEKTQTHVVEVFEPGQGTVFVALHFVEAGPCLGLTEAGVTGTAAAEVVPTNVEGQEGLLVFPSPAIAIVKHEGVEKKIKLETAGLGATFTGAYGARLATFPEKFGAFE